MSVKELLTRAGEQLEVLDDGVTEAEELYRQAVAAPGEADLDPRCHLLDLLLRRGALAEAADVDRELRHSRPTEALVYEYNAGSWEERDPRRALGWCNRGIRQHEEGDGFSAADLGSLCWQRWLLRERDGQPPDDYDLLGMGWAQQLRAAGPGRY